MRPARDARSRRSSTRATGDQPAAEPDARRGLMTNETIAPHGGTLVDLLVPGDEGERLAEEAERHPKVVVNHRELSDLEMLANGALSPLTGFQGEKDYRSILETMHLTNGLPWTIPVTLSISDDELAA